MRNYLSESGLDLEKESLNEGIRDDLANACDFLGEAGIPVDVVEHDQEEVRDYLRSVRKKVLTFNRVYALNKMSLNPKWLARIVDGRSNYSAQAENYKGYGIPLRHFLGMNGLNVARGAKDENEIVESLRRLFFRDDSNGVAEEGSGGAEMARPARFLELCGGNCEVSRDLAGRWGEIEFWSRVSELLNQKRYKGQIDEIRNLAIRNISATLSPPPPTPNIIALDYTKEFLDILNNKGIQTSLTDLCLPQQEFLQTSQIPPHSIDFMTLIMALDRLQDLNSAIQNIKSLARKDGTTKLLIGAPLPLSNKSDRHSVRPIPQITYWDPSAPNEPRANMMGTRAEALKNLALYLKANGITPRRIGWQNYEVVSLDSLTATAGELRANHARTLQQLTFRDPELAKLRDSVLSGALSGDAALRGAVSRGSDPCDSGPRESAHRVSAHSNAIPDNQLVCFPQEYELVLLGCEVN